MRKKIFFKTLVIVILAYVWYLAPVFAASANQERILSFESDIKIHPDASMTVTETITVKSSGNEIRRGIYRDFPTQYKDRFGNNYNVDFDVVGVLRDGGSESYHLQSLSNGTRVYIGRNDVYLAPGEYTYTIIYKTNRQLGFFADFDELYWNVTGNGWSFPIDVASATVELPGGASGKIRELDGYTGPMGSQKKNLSSSIDEFGRATFFTTRFLYPREGLTIVVSWPKGYVSEPDAYTRFGYFINDNAGAVAGLAGILIILAYYLIVWYRFGRDPRRETIIPLYSPPDNFSPAAMRYVMKMGFDIKAFTATIIDMAVKGYITINENKGEYTIKKTGEPNSILTTEESTVSSKLFGHQNALVLKNENHLGISSAIANLKRYLKDSFEKVYFITNLNYFFPGLILSILAVIAAGSLESTERLPIAIFMSVWLTGWSFGVTFLMRTLIWRWKDFSHQPGGAIGMTIFVIPFILFEFVGIGVLAYATSSAVIFILGVTIFINFLFYELLKAPTLAGRKVMDKFEGFKMYLSVTEKDRLYFLNPPDKTIKLYERYLAYAFALDVEQAWAEQFSNILQEASGPDREYHPSWYSGSAWSSFGLAGFTQSLGSSLSSAISSSSVAPGSSSGGGGGGSSGGGGGGGGGGGW